MEEKYPEKSPNGLQSSSVLATTLGNDIFKKNYKEQKVEVY
jgi:hypothetical protein